MFEAELAIEKARSYFQKDAAYRNWATQMGGVYVLNDDGRLPITGQPSIPGPSTLVMNDGRRLSLVVPEHLTRLVQQEGSKLFGHKGKITSLHPLNPKNSPDAWEKAALAQLNAGAEEVTQVFSDVETGILRYMGRLKVEDYCGRCHSEIQSKQSGNAGGISFSVPLSRPWENVKGSGTNAATISYVVIWGLGLCGIAWGWRLLRRQQDDQNHYFEVLAANEEKFRLLFDHAPIASLSMDASGRILTVNDAWTSLLGYRNQEIEGRPISDITSPEDWDTLEEFRSKLVGSVQLGNKEITLIHRKGSSVVVSFNGRAEKSADGICSRIHCVLQDVSEQRRTRRALEESEARYRLIADNTGDVLFLFNNFTNRIEFVSPSVRRVLGFRPEDILGKSIFDFLSPESFEWIIKEHPVRIASYEAGSLSVGTQTYEVSLKTPNGQFVPTEVTSTLLPDTDGRPVRMLGVIREVSKRKQYENALAALLRGTASSTGEEFAKTLVRELAQTLGVNFVFLGKLIQRSGRRIRTIAFWANGRLVDNIEYDLAGTPCEFVIGSELKFYNKDLLRYFPKDDLLAQMKIESYLGVALLSRDGRSIGNLVAMDTKSMVDSPAIQSLFNIFAARASAEIERSDALDALAESANRFKQIVENSRAGFFRLGLDGRYEDVNRSWLDLHGYKSRHEVIGKHFSLTQVESDLSQAAAMIEQVLSGRGHPPGEFTRRRKDGSIGYHTYSACAVTHEGKIVGLECFLIDTTTLRKVEADYAMLFNEMVDAFSVHEIICDEHGLVTDFRYISVNPAFEKLTGRKASDVVGRTHREIDPNADIGWIAKLGSVALSGRSTTFEHLDASLGRMYSVNAFQSAPRRFACTFTDITERKRAEDDLAQDEAELAAIHEHVPMMLLLIDRDGNVRRYNRTAAEFSNVFSLPDQLETPGSFLRCIHSFDTSKGCGQGPNCTNCTLSLALADSIRNGTPHHREECILRLLRGEKTSDISLLFSTAQVRIGEDSMVLLCLEDITPQKEAEARIMQQAALLDITRDAICVLSSDYAIEYWNRGAEMIFGWAASEATGCDWETLIFKQESPEFRDAWAIIIEKGEWMGELLALRKEGDSRTLQCRGTRVDPVNGGPVSVLLVCTDITEAKQLEIQLLHMQRIESLGSIASGIAHDLNNILSPIMMSVDLLPARLTDPEDTALIEMLRASAHRGSEIVQQLLLFSRGSDTPRQLLNPGRVVVEMASIVRQTFPRNINLITEVPADLWEVLADSTQIHQVVLNLCVNARDAMDDGGTLRLHLENVTIGTDRPDAKSGPYVLIRISDTGCGISPDHLDLIFDPFFTTKPIGKGTGLGLSTALGIVKSHGGFIKVKSRTGEGTDFSVFLPALIGTTLFAKVVEEEADWKGNQELIMVVDDEQSVQQLLDLALIKNNFRVIQAADGANAVALFAQQAGEVRAVITDMMMPNMDGMLTIHCLRQINPTIPIIAMSGMHEQATLIEKSGEPNVRFILKPFTVKKMLALLRELLTQSKQAEP